MLYNVCVYNVIMIYNYILFLRLNFAFSQDFNSAHFPWGPHIAPSSRTVDSGIQRFRNVDLVGRKSGSVMNIDEL